MATAGVTDPDDVDCLVAMIAGLIEAQLSNEPGGDRWLRHLDRMIDRLADHANEKNRRRAPRAPLASPASPARRPASSPRPSSRSSPTWWPPSPRRSGRPTPTASAGTSARWSLSLIH